MKISKICTLAGVTAMCITALSGQQAHANKITGAITFAGKAQLDTASAGTATQVTNWSNVKVESHDGDFDSYVTDGEAATFVAPWTFGLGKSGLWSVEGFTFDLVDSNIDSQMNISPTVAFVYVSGYGYISGNGYESTYGTFSFSTQNPAAGTPASFSFSASGNAVPDGGSGVILMGLALLSVEGLRRKFVLA